MRDLLFKTLIFFAFLVGNIVHANAQSISVTLVVTKTNGEELSYQLTEESQMYFENGDRLVIEDGAGTNMTFQLAEIQKLVCTEYANVGENNSSALLLTPNPARDHFLINNLQNEGEARLYSLDGRLMKSFIATEGMIVDISELAPGMYLLHIDGQTLKMMKL